MLIPPLAIDRWAKYRGEAFTAALYARGRVSGEGIEIDEATMRELMDAHPHRIGFGDAVAAVAQPIARAIDAVAGTKIHECGGCKKRQAALNGALPDILHPFQSQ